MHHWTLLVTLSTMIGHMTIFEAGWVGVKQIYNRPYITVLAYARKRVIVKVERKGLTDNFDI